MATDSKKQKLQLSGDWKHINGLKVLCADMVQKANSGHPGAPMGLSPVSSILFRKHLQYNPQNPSFPNRDRFVLSNGHACALQYALLFLTGYKSWTINDLQTFRQLNSKTPGHPENNDAHGIEVTTGPLGQGFANAVGLAMAEKHLAARFNKPDAAIVDHYTYVLCGDGCLMEGVSGEASSLAGHLGLGKLIVIYDDNQISIDGSTDLAFTEDVKARYEAYGWHVSVVEDGDSDLEQIEKAIKEAKDVKDKPSLIKLSTTIGIGSKKEGTEGVHGSPLGEDDLKQVKKKYGFDPEKTFVVSEEMKQFFDHKKEGEELEKKWNALFEDYYKKYPELGKEFKRRLEGKLPDGWKADLPKYTKEDGQLASRKVSGAVLNILADRMPEIFGGSADLNPSCFTYIKSSPDFQKTSPEGRNVRFGVREHGMAAIMNGLACHGLFIPFGSTFFNFIGYAYGAVVLSALSSLRTLYVMTHDSIGLGEDGPTHQQIEKLQLCRETPNLLTFRPGDGNEVVGTYILAIENKTRPSVIALSRQNMPKGIDGCDAEKVKYGGYVVADAEGGKPDVVLVATGSELTLADQAKEKLKGTLNVRVVSMPCTELFDEQEETYKANVLPDGVPVMSIEAGSVGGWTRYAHASIGMTTFGASGKLNDVLEHFGFTVENVVEKAKKLVEFYKGKNVPDLVHRAF